MGVADAPGAEVRQGRQGRNRVRPVKQPTHTQSHLWRTASPPGDTPGDEAYSGSAATSFVRARRWGWIPCSATKRLR